MTTDTTAKADSFKTRIKNGEIRRADSMKVRFGDLHVEEGFNLRDETEDFHASVRALADYIKEGGTYPALEVRIRPEGGVWVVDGHRRRLAIALAISEGCPIEWIEIKQFVGNDAERTARIITSAEGRNLTPLEIARGYKRLRGFGLSTVEIARMVSKTRPHVESHLVLGDADIGLQHMVRDGVVSATIAIQTIRDKGDKALGFLAKLAQQAQAGGEPAEKVRITSKTINGRAISQHEARRLMTAAREMLGAVSPEDRATLAAGLGQATITLPAWAVLGLRDALNELEDRA